jgi:glucokinase
VGGLQCKLLKYVEDEIGECEVEHVCCGDGLARIYNFLCTELNTNEPMLDPAEITEKALSGTCSICVTTVKIFLEILVCQIKYILNHYFYVTIRGQKQRIWL